MLFKSKNIRVKCRYILYIPNIKEREKSFEDFSSPLREKKDLKKAITERDRDEKLILRVKMIAFQVYCYCLQGNTANLDCLGYAYLGLLWAKKCKFCTKKEKI